MTKKIKSFVDNYIAILDMKKKYDFDKNSKFMTKDAALSTLVLIVIFFGFGLIFNYIQNLHYLFISVNIIFIGFLIVLLMGREKRFMYRYDLDYSVSQAVRLDLSFYISILMMANAVILYLLYKDYVNILLILSFAVLGIALFLTNQITFRYLKKHGVKFYNYHRSTILSLIWLFVLYISLLYGSGLKSITWNYLVASAVIGTLFIWRTYIKKFIIMNSAKFTIISVVMIIIGTGIAFMGYQQSYQTDAVFNRFIDTGLKYEKTYKMDINNVFTSDTNIYYKDGNKLEIFDKNMNYIQTIDPKLDNIYQYYIEDGKLKVLVSPGTIFSLEEFTPEKVIKQYDLSNDFIPKLDFTTALPSNKFKIDNHRWTFFEYNGDQYVVSYYNYDTKFYLLNHYDQEVAFSNSSNILINNSDYDLAVKFSNSNSFRYFDSNYNPLLDYSNTITGINRYDYYSNGVVSINNGGMRILFGPDFLKNKTISWDSLNNSDSHLVISRGETLNFYSDDNFYYYAQQSFGNKSNYLLIFDKSGNLVRQIDNTNNLIFTNTVFLTGEEINGVNYVHVTKKDDLTTLYVSGKTKYFNNLSFLMFGLAMLLAPIRLSTDIWNDENDYWGYEND